ncbi:MAG: serine/threonine protein kinase [Gemmatimonadota bacterium]|nr:serine/threonine protein kinase [Gemmatimonadota bacterium]
MAAKKPKNSQTSQHPASLPPPLDPIVEQEMRDAEELALAASSLGSGLLRRQATTESAITVPVLKVCPQCGTEFETSVRFCPSDGTALRPKGSDSLVGRVLAERYHILKRIGEGGMGRVYLGEHVKMNRQCAIKVMSPALVNDHESAARFAREASSAARIIHPNVAAVFDYGESDGLVYLVMEYVDGEPLSRIMAREAPLSLDRSVDLARQIADGLGSAHELGIVHRDLKPDNILITRNKNGREVAKVVDFGIAKVVKENASDALTRTGLVIGTPEFMSPEQLLGDPIDARSDLYALGCIVHLMLTASPPFSASTREQMIKRRLTEDAPHIQHLDPGLPDSLDRIVVRLLARNPVERYASAAEVRDALSGTHARRHDVVNVLRTPQPTPRSAPTLSFESAMLAPTEQTDVAPAPRRRMVLAGLGVVALAGSLLAVRGLRQDPPPAAAPSKPVAAAQPVPAATIAPPVATPVKKALIDSASRARSAARRLRRDSVAKAASASASASASVPQQVRTAIDGYARAIESKRVDKLKEAYPGLTADQQKGWETGVFAIANAIKASVTYNSVVMHKDGAEVDFTLTLAYDYPGSQGGIPRMKQNAILQEKDGLWQIREIR